MTITAYLNDPAIKAELLEHLEAHRAADQIVQGTYWEKGKGCAVGCSLESWKKARGLESIEHGNHAIYNDIFGPGGDLLARLEDAIFEGLKNGEAKDWPIRFMAAIRPGADLSCVGWKFLHWLLTDEKVNHGINDPLVKDAVRQCADVLVPLTKGEPVDVSAARSAASAAWSAARSAVWSAESAACAASAASAAYSLMADKLVELLEAA